MAKNKRDWAAINARKGKAYTPKDTGNSRGAASPKGPKAAKPQRQMCIRDSLYGALYDFGEARFLPVQMQKPDQRLKGGRQLIGHRVGASRL